ncbi:MAG: hypothetical protein IJI14_01460 [Anaerolineaceae bacterium]|nr:hypothetical protein [Anaerolineaceae bacterium]
MNRLLGRRTLREFGAHGMRYLALGVMISFAIYLIVSLIGAADTIILGTAEHAEKNRIEDGQFSVFVPLTDEELRKLHEKDIETEPMFYLDYELPDESVLRVFRVRQSIDMAELESGAFPENSREILLERRYCEVKRIIPGSTIEIAGERLTVSGIVTTPDYDALFRSMGDSTADSANFGTAFVTENLYNTLKSAEKSLRSEEYLYAYRLNGKMNNEELKELLLTFTFDPDKVDDLFFREYWQRIYGKRDDLLSGSDELAEGALAMSDALTELETSLKKAPVMFQNLLPDDMKQGISELTESGNNLSSVSAEMREAIHELVDSYWSMKNDNLLSFVPAEDNPRIGAASDDVIINKYASILAGVIVLGLLSYVISVFVIHSIEQEQSVIGTLYALGVRRNELLQHYLVLPVVISFLSGAVGTVLGYSRYGVPLQTADTYSYFSVPSLHTVIEIWVIIYGVVLPPLTAALVNWIVIRRKLSAPALQMIRNEEKRRDISQIDLKNMGFIRCFQLRQLLREGRSAAGVILGIFICLLLMMIGINAWVLCIHVGQDNIQDTKYEYMYLYKYPEEHVPDGGYPAYAESFKKEALGYNMDVTVLGLEPYNPFFDGKPKKSQNHVLISSAMAQKYGLSVGDHFSISDSYYDRLYAFTVDDIVTYAPAFYIFMDIVSMRNLFGADDDYYNVVFSDHDLNIDPGRLYSVSSRSDVEKAANVFSDLMYGLVFTMIIASAVIMAIVMYLMMKVMIDRSAQGISLFKIFGYRKRELSVLFLDGSTFLILAGTLAAIPLSKLIMDALYPYLVSNVACAINLHFEPWLYAVLFTGIMTMYFLIHVFLVKRINKININLVLKNRE